jgi:hypothetical protein
MVGEVLMSTALYTNESNAITADCPCHPSKTIAWADELPPPLKDLVVRPISFDVARDYDLQADHTHGRDAANQPCYSAFRFVLTRLHSDDDEVFYEAPVYAESLTSWRLVDERWLVRRSVVGNFEDASALTSFSLSDVMPR